MHSTSSVVEPNLGYFASPCPIGFDAGAGWLKLCIDSQPRQKRVRMPSKVIELQSPLIEDLAHHEGGHFYYQSGARTDLVGKEFLVGILADWKAPTSHVKLSDDPALKAEYALQCLLGGLSSLGYRQEWNIILAISTHAKDVFGERIKANVSGEHIVSFGGKNKPYTRVNVSSVLVVPEGAGAYIHAKNSELLCNASNLIGIDLGMGTVITSVFSPTGKLINHQALAGGGVVDLLDALASNPEMLRAVGTGKAASTSILCSAIESRDFHYGATGFDFTEIYKKELQLWLAIRLRQAFKACEEWRDRAEVILVWGGGSELPGLQTLLKSTRVSTLSGGSFANAIGIQSIAAALAAKAGS